jgi:hypothetical protein
VGLLTSVRVARDRLRIANPPMNPFRPALQTK